MPLKTYYTAEADIPENLKGAYVARDGKWILDKLETDHPTIVALEEIKQKHSTLTTQNAELMQDKTRLEAGKLPDGKVAVDPEIEKLGNAAKSAGLKQTELSTLKSDYASLKDELEKDRRASRAEKAAKAAGLNDKFALMAKDKGLDFEIAKEGEGDDAKDVPYVLGEGGAKTKVEDFIAKDDFFSRFADTFKDEQSSPPQKKWGEQNSGKDTKPPNLVEQEMQAARATGKYSL